MSPDHDQLMAKIEAIKKKCQKAIKNDKMWNQIEGEEDELINRLKKLKTGRPKPKTFKPSGFWMKKYAFIDEPREETVKLVHYAFIDESKPVKQVKPDKAVPKEKPKPVKSVKLVPN